MPSAAGTERDHDEALEHYLHEIRQVPLLTAAEEMVLGSSKDECPSISVPTNRGPARAHNRHEHTHQHAHHLKPNNQSGESCAHRLPPCRGSGAEKGFQRIGKEGNLGSRLTEACQLGDQSRTNTAVESS